MFVQEQLDRAIGAPQVTVDVEHILATGRAQQRRRRVLASGVAAAVIAAAAGGTWWVSDRDEVDAAQQQVVTLDTCTAEQLAQVPGVGDGEAGEYPVLVTGAASVCVNAELRLVDRIDQPLAGHQALALRLAEVGQGAKATDEVNVLVVWGARGLPDSVPVVEFDIDWTDPSLLRGEENRQVSRPLADYVAQVNATGLGADPGRGEGWSHCDGASFESGRVVTEVGGRVCVAPGYEVLSHADGVTLLDSFVDVYQSEIGADEQREIAKAREQMTGASGWEVVGADGLPRYQVLGLDEGNDQAQTMPMRVPMSLLFSMFPAFSTMEGSSSDSSDSSGFTASSTASPSTMADAGPGTDAGTDAPTGGRR